MIKLVIADSDFDNIINFKSFIKKNFTVFKVEKSAVSVNELEERLNNRNPELIIVDIRFFGSNVLNYMKQTNLKYPKLKFILYGSYGDNDYMQKCMEYGAIAYMYKPVKSIELERCLNTAIEVFEEEKRINSEQKALLNQYKEEMILFETKFLSTLVHGHITNEDEIINSFEYFNISVKPPYSVAILRIDHYKKVVLTLEEHEKHLIILGIINIINNELLKLDNGKAFVNEFNEIIIIFGKYSELDDIKKMFAQIKEIIQKKYEFSISIGLGKPYNSISDIKTSFNEAAAALRYRCIIGYNSIIPIDFVEPYNNITYKYPLEREELLVYTAVIGEYDYCMKLLKEIMNSLKECGRLPKVLISQIIMDILISINRNAFEQNLNIVGVNKFFSTQKVFELNDIDEAYDYFSKGLKKFCKYMIEIRTEKEKELYLKAVEYIQNNYFETISVNKMSNIFNCSTEYFKKIFKENSGKSLSEFVTNIRIDRAKELILSSDLDDASIAVKIGYDDSAIFRAAFKQQEKYTVTDYRHANGKYKSINF